MQTEKTVIFVSNILIRQTLQTIILLNLYYIYLTVYVYVCVFFCTDSVRQSVVFFVRYSYSATARLILYSLLRVRTRSRVR